MPEPNRPSGSEASSALEAVLKDQEARKQRRDAAPQRPPDRGPLMTALAVVFFAATVWILVARPDVLQPPPPPPPPPQVMSAGLRMDIYVAAVQVLDYQAETGRLPALLVDALEEAEDGEGLTLESLGGGRFRITGRRGADQASYESTQPLSEFLADARQVLEAAR